jgi:diguanylate cyclase (GGDEF)-like protein
LQRHFLRRLLVVVALFAVGIVLSIGFSLQSNRESQQDLLRVEAEQARTHLLRQLESYQRLADSAAEDPQLARLLTAGTVRAQQEWALARQHLLPELLGIALVDRSGEVLGDPALLRVGPECRDNVLRAGALGTRRLLLHLTPPGAEHVELLSPVRDADGTLLGGVFLSARLAQLQRVIDDSVHPGHAIALVDAEGNSIVSSGRVEGALWEERLSLADTGWQLVAQAPVQWLTVSGGRQVVAGLLTLAAVLVALIAGMLQLRRAMLNDIVTTRDALAALARDEPAPAILPRYAEFEPAIADINLIALHLQEQRAQLAHLSLTDPLTGLPNRRAFETHFPQALGLAERQHRVALVMLDIDRFKGINDRFGHGVGDQVLIALARSLQQLTRRADLAARLAGDEFAVLLADVDEAGVATWYLRLADRFRGELNALGLVLETGLSAGQAWLGAVEGDSLNAALARADRALYEAKARGRGQLVRDTASPDAAG